MYRSNGSSRPIPIGGPAPCRCSTAHYEHLFYVFEAKPPFAVLGAHRAQSMSAGGAAKLSAGLPLAPAGAGYSHSALMYAGTRSHTHARTHAEPPRMRAGATAKFGLPSLHCDGDDLPQTVPFVQFAGDPSSTPRVPLEYPSSTRAGGLPTTAVWWSPWAPHLHRDWLQHWAHPVPHLH
jgi:hypothetical protein